MTRHKSRGFGYSIEGGANRAFTLDSAQNRLLVMLQNKSKDLDHLPVTARVLEKMAL
jgi:hypothetical protein